MSKMSSSIAGSPQKKKMLVIGTCSVLVLCVLWLAFLFRDSFIPPPVATAPDSPRDRTAAEMQAKIREDKRFEHIDVIPDPQSPSGYLVTGDLKKGESESAVRDAITTIAGGAELRFDVHIMR